MSDDTSTPADRDGLTPAEQRSAVRERYSDIAANSTSCCDDTESSSCCGDDTERLDADDQSRKMGYSDDELDAVPAGANLGLGCGNPTALAALDGGETVLDLGSGAGFDCFLAADEVGERGHVIGVDMTPEMVEKARENAADYDDGNVEFRLGEIEHLPVADETVDFVISNCVVNLSPDKPQVFDEAFRVLRPGGRVAISDVVLTTALPPGVHADPTSVASCIAGASTVSDLESMLDDSGFEDVAIEPKEDSEEFINEWDDERDVSEYVVSATIEATKPPR